MNSDNATPSAPSLADEFAALSQAATPGPWLAFDNEECTEVSRGDSEIGVVPNYYTLPENELEAWESDAAFIAFCGTNRDAILAALRAAESDDAKRNAAIALVVLAPTDEEAIALDEVFWREASFGKSNNGKEQGLAALHCIIRQAEARLKAEGK